MTKTLTKSELADLLVDSPAVGLTKKDAKEFVDLVFEKMRHALEQGIELKISSFGNWSLRDKKQRPGRNPKTGEETLISSRRVVTFKPGQKLKDRVEKFKGDPKDL